MSGALTPVQIAAAVRQHWPKPLSDAEVATAVAIALAESSGRPNLAGPRNKDGSTDYGLFQVNSRYWIGPPKDAHGRTMYQRAGVAIPPAGEKGTDLYNVPLNIKRAAVIRESQPEWRAWTVVKTGKYKDFMPQAAKAAEETAGTGSDASLLNPFSIAGAASGAAGQAVTDNVVSPMVETVTRIYASAIMYVIALVLFIVGVLIVLRKPAAAAAKAAANAAMPAKSVAAKAVKAAVT